MCLLDKVKLFPSKALAHVLLPVLMPMFGIQVKEVEFMKKQLTMIVSLVLGLVLIASSVHAQTGQPRQSLSPTQSACTSGSQSVRVCNNDLQSCNDVCSARALDVNADIAGCTTACCNRFNVCLRSRNCGALVIDCN